MIKITLIITFAIFIGFCRSKALFETNRSQKESSKSDKYCESYGQMKFRSSENTLCWIACLPVPWCGRDVPWSASRDFGWKNVLIIIFVNLIVFWRFLCCLKALAESNLSKKNRKNPINYAEVMLRTKYPINHKNMNLFFTLEWRKNSSSYVRNKMSTFWN